MWIAAAGRARRALPALPLAGLLVFAAPAAADPAEKEAAAAQREPGFLFGRPGNSVGLRLNWHRARAESDVHDFLTETLTLEPRDFDALGVAFDLGFAVMPRLDVRFGIDFVKTPDTNSEFREFIGSDDLPIAQDTTLAQTDFNGSVSFALTPRGRSIGQYAWIPSAVVPYVGAGAGMQWYGLDLVGEFVDAATFEIFDDHLEANGWAPSVPPVRRRRHPPAAAAVPDRGGAVCASDRRAGRRVRGIRCPRSVRHTSGCRHPVSLLTRGSPPRE